MKLNEFNYGGTAGGAAGGISWTPSPAPCPQCGKCPTCGQYKPIQWFPSTWPAANPVFPIQVMNTNAAPANGVCAH